MIEVPGFRRIESGQAQVWAVPEAEAWVEVALSRGTTLFDAARSVEGADTLEGRGPVYVIPASESSTRASRARDGGDAEGGSGQSREAGRSSAEGRARWVVRHYHRGGWMAPLLGDRYLPFGVPRPLRELTASTTVRARSIDTPRVVAAAVYRGRVFMRGDLVTEYVPRSEDLAQVLFGESRQGLGGAVDRREALLAAGELVRKLAMAGVAHPDLNAKNILLEWEGAAPRAHLLDLDRCEVAESPLPIPPASMHERLIRSLRKWERRTGIRLTENEWKMLEGAVTGAA